MAGFAWNRRKCKRNLLTGKKCTIILLWTYDFKYRIFDRKIIFLFLLSSFFFLLFDLSTKIWVTLEKNWDFSVILIEEISWSKSWFLNFLWNLYDKIICNVVPFLSNRRCGMKISEIQIKKILMRQKIFK